MGGQADLATALNVKKKTKKTSKRNQATRAQYEKLVEKPESHKKEQNPNEYQLKH